MKRLTAVVLLSLVVPALAQTRPATTQSGPGRKAGPDEKLVVTDHRLRVGERVMAYRVSAGTLVLRDEGDKPKAGVFYVAYERTDIGTKPGDRPVTFVFNGGPGAAAVWLHLGTAGPRRIALGDDGDAPAPPYRLIDNADTWLDVSDLVFIDPVGTGFSRAAPGQDAKEFYNVNSDVRWVGEFIRLFLTRFDRWTSPKFLAGESYGTTRAAALSNALHEQQGIDLNGILLISTVLNFQTIEFGDNNDLPYVLYLPSYTAAAWYHKKLAPELQQDLDKTLAEVRRWALEEYSVLLIKGDRLGDEQRRQAVAALARFTGLSADLIDRSRLRITPGVFQKSLLGPGRVVGRMDARLTGPDLDASHPWPQFDTSLSRYFGVYAGTINAYLREELEYASDLTYEVLSPKVQWDFNRGRGMGYLNVGDDLRTAMAKNPHLKVLVESGYFDLATPFLATDYTIDHLGLSPDLKKNVRQAYHPGGHMMYHVPAVRRELHEEVSQFIRSAVAPQD